MGGTLVLVGFMGAGKSSALPGVLDTDALLERELGTSIAEFFAQHGESEFRRREEEVVLRALAGGGDVVALGGGSVTSVRVREALAEHTVAWLDVGADEAWRRVQTGMAEEAFAPRPLATDRGAFDARHAERQPLYESVADAFLPEGDPGLVARALPALRALPAGCKLVWARSAGGEYPVFVGRGAPDWSPSGRAFVVTDEHVARLHPRESDPHPPHVLAAGEEHKTLGAAEALWRAMAQAGLARDDHVVAVGGGVVGDLAGFCAATYQRGIAIVQVPTTVVAQVDSAYGGKTGVDLPEAKNYVGAYHQPAAVLADVATLDTLPREERAAGYAEVVKTALIAGGSLWERVAGGAAVDERIVLDCARTKLAIVAADERDGGARQLLNLGHTVGHAIETATAYRRYRHGEAVGLGLLAALRLSGANDLRAQVAGLLRSAGLPTVLEGADPAAVTAATGRDKKRRGGAVAFVLAAAPGDVRFGQPVGDDDLLAVVEELTAR
ncbi:MAG: bifunctional shikimate kinase/3-dehydroquinate synthase [Solirubrobacterales bacterium]|nr:bifunctional shikimate kinase/3-dehydroquinate synthase [Solirubrobacterales bacterium]